MRLEDFGEGEYATKERAIRSLLVEAGAAGLGGATRVHAITPSEQEVTPESYLAAERAERFTNGAIEPGLHDYGPLPPQPPPLSGLRYAGVWHIGAWNAAAERGSELQLRFRARRGYLVMGATSSGRVHVDLDGRPIPADLAGPDVHDASVTVGFNRLYRLVNLSSVQTHTLTVKVPRGVSAYSFTFG